MAIALRTIIRTAHLVAIVTMCAVAGVSYATEAEEEESYYLSQMRDLADSKKNLPEANAPAAANNELMAETDLKEMAKAAAEVEELDDVSPSLTKPSLPALKPEL